MRSGDPGWEISKHGKPDTWKAGVDPGEAWKRAGAWGTNFTSFRFAIPELCNFEGRAVYLDVDMLVLGDVRELLEMPLTRGYKCISKRRTDVAVIDCGFFKNKPWWPKIDFMKTTGWTTGPYCGILMQHDAIDHTLDLFWNDCDGNAYSKVPGSVKLIHYTSVPDGQPNCPYPKVRYFVPFPHSRNEAIGLLWWNTYREVLGREGLPRLRETLAEACRRVAQRVPEAAYLRKVMLRSGVSEEDCDALEATVLGASTQNT